MGANAAARIGIVVIMTAEEYPSEPIWVWYEHELPRFNKVDVEVDEPEQSLVAKFDRVMALPVFSEREYVVAPVITQIPTARRLIMTLNLVLQVSSK